MLPNLGRRIDDTGTQTDITGGDTEAAAEVEAGKENMTEDVTGRQGPEVGVRAMSAANVLGTRMAIVRGLQTGTVTASGMVTGRGVSGQRRTVRGRTTTTASGVGEIMGVIGHPVPKMPQGMAKQGGGPDLVVPGRGEGAEVLLAMSGECEPIRLITNCEGTVPITGFLLHCNLPKETCGKLYTSNAPNITMHRCFHRYSVNIWYW